MGLEGIGITGCGRVHGIWNTADWDLHTSPSLVVCVTVGKLARPLIRLHSLTSCEYRFAIPVITRYTTNTGLL